MDIQGFKALRITRYGQHRIRITDTWSTGDGRQWIVIPRDEAAPRSKPIREQAADWLVNELGVTIRGQFSTDPGEVPFLLVDLDVQL